MTVVHGHLSMVSVLMGWDPATSGFWTGGFQGRALAGSVFRDVTSVMNIGIVLGALGAAALAGRFAPSLKIPLPSLVAAVLGGVLMGYGARIAFGCNIGAFFSGVASTAGGLVFFGDNAGAFVAARATNGEMLWSRHLNARPRAGAMTYMLDGKQFVAIAAGKNVAAFALP